MYAYVGLGHFPWTFTPGLTPQENTNNVGEIEAGLMKQSLRSGSWIDETILSEAGLIKEIFVVQGNET